MAVLTLIAKPERREWSRREIDLARAAAERIWPAYEVARSLTAERAMLLTLTTNEERLRLALQSSAIGIWEQNPETKRDSLGRPRRKKSSDSQASTAGRRRQ